MTAGRAGVIGRSHTGVLVALCVTEIVSYGCLYYAFTVLVPSIAESTGWSAFGLTAAFSAGSLVGAAAGIPVGRVLQRHGPRPVMTLGSLLGAAGVAAVALAPSFAVFVAAWLLVGVATAGLYYSPAFAALTGWFGQRGVQAITTLTLAAGFASTIFAPFTAFLDDRLGLRGSYIVLGAIVLVVTLPAHALALRLPWQPRPAVSGVRNRDIVGSRAFLMLAVSGTLTALAGYASLVALPPLLIGRGADPTLAAWAVGLAGAGQVAGRLVYPLLNRRMRPRTRTVAVIGLLAVTLAAQAVVPGPDWAFVLIAVLTGAARGLFTLVTATVVADVWGPERYASVSGVYNSPLAAAGALAPGIGAGVAEIAGGYPALFVILAVTATVAAVLAALNELSSVRLSSVKLRT
ncbi:MFS transporter [Gryllotalpicola ginsengisoli]|uniref:MFS transporter n=1 Tax=Gryllotalpicola ginsengisoli TaxID=444608 RepID=UPI0003B6B902|nr:MFS transporter [Gryllotalpicola ginsengisoli]